MERMVQNGYPSTHLCVQNRMCPAIMNLVNSLEYDLKCGPHAPQEGTVEWVRVPGTENEVEHSFTNEDEVNSTVELVKRLDDEEKRKAVVLCPYAAQCRLMLSRRMGVQVHTVDSFQGKEADIVFLSVVRTGKKGMGFWSDVRRVAVALSRARTRLVILLSPGATLSVLLD